VVSVGKRGEITKYREVALRKMCGGGAVFGGGKRYNHNAKKRGVGLTKQRGGRVLTTVKDEVKMAIETCLTTPSGCKR